MLKNDFIEMQRQDLVTSKDINLKQMLLAFEEVLKDYSDSIEIENSKTCEDCYKKMKDVAKKNAQNGSYCFGPEETKKFIIEYLGLNSMNKSELINLDDFI